MPERFRRGRVRVLYVHHGMAPVGGSPTSLRFQIAGLDRSRFEPIVALIAGSRAAPAFRELSVEVLRMPGVAKYGHTTGEWYRFSRPVRLVLQHVRVPLSIWQARRFLRRVRPDIVHLNSSTLWPVARAAHSLRIPVVWHIREYLVDGYLGIRRRWLSRAIRRYAAHVVAISKADLARIEGIPPPPADVIYNFVDFRRFDRAIDGRRVRGTLGIEPGHRVVAFVGGVSKAKGTDVYLEAARRVLAQRNDVRFLLLGSKPRLYGPVLWKRAAARLVRTTHAGYWRRVRALLAEPAIQHGVIDLGARADVPEILAASDLVVFPSTVPHFGRPLVEAAAMAKPAVASDLAGPQEIVLNGQTGVLVPPGQADRLAAAIVELLDDPVRARALGEAAFARARTLFDAAASVQRIEAIYDRVLRSV